MPDEEKRTYTGWKDFAQPSKQTEYTAPTPLLDAEGNLLAKGWARSNVFDYDRARVSPKLRGKEWDFYQISNGRYMVQLSFANISIAGYVSAVLVDLAGGKVLANVMAPFVGGREKYPLPPKGDVPHRYGYTIGSAAFTFDTAENSRTLTFKAKDIACRFTMDILPHHENITTVLPFAGMPTRFFMTTKQNCMPCEGVFEYSGQTCRFSKADSFCVLDWGRVNTPRHMVWYWGNGAGYLRDAAGQQHLFGFEITWGIGDESNATETCLFYDGKAHKIGAVDVETFPKPDNYMRPWRFTSQDGRFNLTMTPTYDHFTDTNLLLLRMVSHQVHGLWNGTAILDDGTVLDIKDLYAFCEYVENKW